MPSTSFKFRCIECGRTVNFEFYWRHVKKCMAATKKRLEVSATVTRSPQ